MSDPAPHAIEFSGVSKWFGALQVLKSIDLGIGCGERVVVCGPSGSGKSTMIRCINGLEPFQEGELRVEGTPVATKSRAFDMARRRIGIVFQQFNLFPHLTVLENLTLAPTRVLELGAREATDRALYYLERVHIAEQAMKYPAQLSGGQQQRVAIARALCMEPKTMLFDEPTSSLDPEMVQEVLVTMIELAAQGITMVCVTHEMGFARQVADRVIFMDQGEIVEQQKPDGFFSAPQTERARIFLGQILQNH